MQSEAVRDQSKGEQLVNMGKVADTTVKQCELRQQKEEKRVFAALFLGEAGAAPIIFAMLADGIFVAIRDYLFFPHLFIL